MERVPVSNDDLMDVIELTDNLEFAIAEILNGHQTTLAISAIINSSINCALSQCNTMEEIMICREMFVRVIDETIKTAHIKNKDS